MWRAFAGAAALALVTTGCSGGSSGKAATPKAKVGETVEVTPGAVRVASARLDPPVAVDDATRAQILDTVKRYVQAASVDPLHTGRGAATIAPLLTAAAGAWAKGPDRAVILDEGLPPATGAITAKAAPVPITVLADPTGTLVLATAGLDLTVASTTARGPVAIHRTGSLTLAPDAGAWKIAGFDLSVQRSGKGVEAAAKAKSSTTTSTKG